MTKMT